MLIRKIENPEDFFRSIIKENQEEEISKIKNLISLCEYCNEPALAEGWKKYLDKKYETTKNIRD